jgi:hypothetical protein
MRISGISRPQLVDYPGFIWRAISSIILILRFNMMDIALKRRSGRPLFCETPVFIEPDGGSAGIGVKIDNNLLATGAPEALT